MRNRAKCKLCGDIIESFHPTDVVECKCGEIAVDRGLGLGCAARDWKNFVRVDDEGNEIVVRITEGPKPKQAKEVIDEWKRETIKQIGEMGLEAFLAESEAIEKERAPFRDEPIESSQPSKKEMLAMLDEMIKSYENLPQVAMSKPVTHYDLLSVLLLVSSILRSD